MSRADGKFLWSDSGILVEISLWKVVSLGIACFGLFVTAMRYPRLYSVEITFDYILEGL